MASQETVFGIDLGTTNSLLCAWHKSQPAIVLVDGQALLPSVVRYSLQGEVIDVGVAAKNARALYEKTTVASVKRSMGQDKRLSLGTGQNSVRPEEASGHILQALLAKADYASSGLDVPSQPKVVITVPAQFSESARRATLEAAHLAGLNVLRLINEPTAAALAFHQIGARQDLNRPVESQEIFMVYDLGGGTFDVSLVERNDEHFEVLSSEGNNLLGGDDFDTALRDLVVARLAQQGHSPNTQQPVFMTRLLQLAEEAKKRLSLDTHARILDSNASSQFGHPIDVSITREEFESCISTRVEETIGHCQKALLDAGLHASSLKRILLVGGSSRIPLVQRRLAESFSGTELDSHVNPDLAVAMGAAMQAALIVGQEMGTVLVDVAPKSLGIAVVDEECMEQAAFTPILMALKFAPIIRKNTALPVTMTHTFATMGAFQDSVEVKVAQGEHALFADNEEIGSFRYPIAVPTARGQKLDVQLGYTSDGLVRVLARCEHGEAKEVLFRSSLSGHSQNFELRAANENLGLAQGEQNIASSDSSIALGSSEPDNVILRRVVAVLAVSTALSASKREHIERLATAYRQQLSTSNTAEIDALEDELLDALESL